MPHIFSNRRVGPTILVGIVEVSFLAFFIHDGPRTLNLQNKNIDRIPVANGRGARVD